jgi:dipeptide/tripeptide permease
VEILENLAYLANASNLVLYLKEYMHMSPSKSANNVTNFMGTSFLLALLGGFLSDAFFTTYHVYLISAVIELIVSLLILLLLFAPPLLSLHVIITLLPLRDFLTLLTHAYVLLLLPYICACTFGFPFYTAIEILHI